VLDAGTLRTVTPVSASTVVAVDVVALVPTSAYLGELCSGPRPDPALGDRRQGDGSFAAKAEAVTERLYWGPSPEGEEGQDDPWRCRRRSPIRQR